MKSLLPFCIVTVQTSGELFKPIIVDFFIVSKTQGMIFFKNKSISSTTFECD